MKERGAMISMCWFRWRDERYSLREVGIPNSGLKEDCERHVRVL